MRDDSVAFSYAEKGSREDKSVALYRQMWYNNSEYGLLLRRLIESGGRRNGMFLQNKAFSRLSPADGGETEWELSRRFSEHTASTK